ncbi:DedA family protein [uncultured Clostridium sp.]|uniref:DedA family protein n=1 Tax=uncultured Clostridium sp. TaxID=59620 RepID=UPI0025D64FE6|nr:DedA family protein [uncultured Clostridium sp.]
MMNFIDELLHFDRYIPMIMDNYGVLIYVLLFLIIFCETGLVVTPFLPGDSIIFACGALAAISGMNIVVLIIVFWAAAILGDGANYLIGKKLGEKLVNSNNRFIKKSYIDKAQSFYEKYGSKAIVLARFVPIVRTFAPFVAGIGKMCYKKFGVFNIIGGTVWISLFLALGFFFGNIPVIKNNFSLVTVGIILISLLPVLVEVIKHMYSVKSQADS